MATSNDAASNPMETIRRLRDRLLGAAGNAADVVTGSEAFGQTMARTMNAAAAATASVRSVAHSGAEMAAGWLNIPTRRQLIELATRINRIELILDDLDVAASELLDRLEEAEDG